MNIPNLPTDNLYKFIALTGVLLFVITNFYPGYQRIKIRDEISLYNGDIYKLEVEQANARRKQKTIKKQLERLDKKMNVSSPSIINDSIIVRSIILDGPAEIVELSSQIDVLVEEYSNICSDLNIKQIETNTKLHIIRDKESDLEELKKMSYFFYPFSILLTCFGFIFWYTKTQIYQDRVLEEQARQFLNKDTKQMKHNP